MRTLLAAAVLLAFFAAPAAAADFVLDKPHTQAQFTVVHLGFSKVNGLIPLVSGTMTVGPNNLPTAATATFDVTNLETYDPNRNASLRDRYFEAAKYPTITFVERKVTGTPDNFVMTGDLTIHGVTKTVDLAGKLEATVTIRGKQNIAYSATTQIDRRDFGMTFGPLLDNQLIAGNQVTITIEAAGIAQ
jgi:polyisoprenoid-binding protein YceI